MSFSAGIQWSRIQKKTGFYLRACLQIQTVSQIFHLSSLSAVIIRIFSRKSSLFVTGGTRCRPSSTQQRKCPHGENEQPVMNADSRAEDVQSAVMWWCWCCVLKGGRFTSSWGVFTRVWPAGSSWTVCSSWRKSAAMERIESLNSERFLPSWKVTKTEKLEWIVVKILRALKEKEKVELWMKQTD